MQQPYDHGSSIGVVDHQSRSSCRGVPVVSQSYRLGDLQLAIMRVLWEQSEATVSAVHRTLLPARGLALTTIATMLSKMEKKGVVSHRQDGRQFVYHATIAEHEVHQSMVEDLVDRLFGGDTTALVNHLLTDREIDPAELSHIKSMITDRQRQLKERSRNG